MEAKDILVVCISGTALLWSIVSYFLNKASAQRAGDKAEAANTIAKETGRRLAAETELSVLRVLSESRALANERFVRVKELEAGRTENKMTADEKRLVAHLTTAWKEAVELMLNAYELGCGLYLDGGKLDNERFYRQYHDEIKRLYELGEPYKELLHPLNSPYTAIRKVHDRWHNKEKD